MGQFYFCKKELRQKSRFRKVKKFQYTKKGIKMDLVLKKGKQGMIFIMLHFFMKKRQEKKNRYRT